MLRSVLFFLCCALFLGACSSQVGDDVVKKYEEHLNANFKKMLLQEMQEIDTPNVRVEADNFTCKADGKFVLCENFNFVLLEERSEVKEVKIVQSQGIVLRSNQLYLGDREGNISLKDAVDDMFKNNDKIQVSSRIKSLKFGDEVVKEIKAMGKFFGDAKIAAFMQEWVEDSYDFDMGYDIAQDEKNYNWTLNLGFDNAKDNNINISARTILDKNFWASSGNELLFDTTTQNIAERTAQDFEKNARGVSEISPLLHLKDLQVDIALQTKGAFSPYLAMARAQLQTLKNQQGANEEEIRLYDKIINLIEDLDKNPLYKLNFNLLFRDDSSLDDFRKRPEKFVEKITINGKDFSEILQMTGLL